MQIEDIKVAELNPEDIMKKMGFSSFSTTKVIIFYRNL